MVGTVNASREHFESGVRDMAQSELQFPGRLGRLLTHPVKGLEGYSQLYDTLTTTKGAIKVYCEVAAFEGALVVCNAEGRATSCTAVRVEVDP